MKIIILGNSLAAMQIISQVKRLNPESEMTLFAFEEERIVSRDLFVPLLAQQKPPQALYCDDPDFYRKHNVRVIKEDKPERVNFNRGQLTTLAKEKLAFDFIVIDETGQNRLPAIRGIQKSGVFALRRLSDTTQILSALPVAETVVVISDTLWGLKTACALLRREKEVILVTSDARLLEKQFDPETTRVIQDNVERIGLRVVAAQSVSEILGDSDLKAIRLASGKVISCQMVIYPDAGPELKLFKDSGLEYKENIPVSGCFQTNFENAFAVNRSIGLRAEAHDQFAAIMVSQGAIVAGCMNGEKQDFILPLMQGRLDLAGWDMQFVGDCAATPLTQIVTRSNQEKAAQLKFFLQNQLPVGAVFINWQQDQEKIRDLILHPEQNPECFEIFNGELLANLNGAAGASAESPESQLVLEEGTPSDDAQGSALETDSPKQEGLV